MSRYTIQRITEIGMQGPVIVDVADAESLEYHGEWMADEYITVTVKSPVPVDFKIDDYIVYRGDYYALGYDPNVVKKAARNTYGEGFTYDNIRFYSIAGKLKGYGFKDYVLEDNLLAYSSLGKFSFYAGSVEDLADRIQANINRQDIDVKTLLMRVVGQFKVLTPNWARCQQRGITQTEWEEFYDDASTYGEWGVGEGVTLGERDVDVQADEIYCFDAMKFAYTKFGLSWYSKCDSTITYFVIGGPAIIADKGEDSRMIFRYGRNLGLYEIERTSPDDQELVTRMFAYGSENNLPLNYYANIGKKAYITGTRDMVEQTATQTYSYGVATEIPYSTIRGALTNASTKCLLRYVDGQNVSHTVYANANATTNEGTKYLYMSLQNNGGDAVAFYNAMPDNTAVTVYVDEGVNINAWPTSYIEIPQDYNYPALLSVNRLMLPGFPTISLDAWVQQKIASYDPGTTERQQWETFYDRYDFSQDRYDPWVLSKNSQYAGVIEGTANFDGTNQKEIKPTIEGTGYNVVGWGSDANPGVVSSNVITITDNGYVEDGGDFTICMAKEGGLDWKALFETRSEDDMVITMTSGYCVGLDFKVVNVEEGYYDYVRTQYPCWVLVCERKQDDLGRFMPCVYQNEYGMFHVLNGDTFSVTGIEIPDEYIAAASEKLLIASCAWLDRRDHVRYTYLPKVDNIYMARQDEAVRNEENPQTYGTVSLHDTLRAGMRMEFEDAADLGIERIGSASPYIDVLTIREDGGDGIPSYDVVLRDEKERGTLEALTDKIEDLLAKPTENIVERTSRPYINVDYQEWISGHPYYYQTLNPNPDPAINDGEPYIETSYVWHKGKKWMCLRTLTAEEPGLGCSDWKVVEGDQTFALKFYKYDSGAPTVPTAPYGEYISTRRTNINIPIVPVVYWGTEDVTAKVNSWQWKRYLINGTEDTGWRGGYTIRWITIVTEDMPTGWSGLNPAKFECVATILNIDTEISADVII